MLKSKKKTIKEEISKDTNKEKKIKKNTKPLKKMLAQFKKLIETFYNLNKELPDYFIFISNGDRNRFKTVNDESTDLTKKTIKHINNSIENLKKESLIDKNKLDNINILWIFMSFSHLFDENLVRNNTYLNIKEQLLKYFSDKKLLFLVQIDDLNNINNKLYANKEELSAEERELNAKERKLYANKEELYANMVKLYANKEKLYDEDRKLYANKEELNLEESINETQNLEKQNDELLGFIHKQLETIEKEIENINKNINIHNKDIDKIAENIIIIKEQNYSITLKIKKFEDERNSMKPILMQLREEFNNCELKYQEVLINLKKNNNFYLDRKRINRVSQ